MRKKNEENKILNAFQQLNIPKNEWIICQEISSIIFKDGKGIYPDWKHLRLLFDEYGRIFIKYGESIPYGARLPLNANFHPGYDFVSFFGSFCVPETEYYKEFRLPKSGDMIRIADASGRVFGESMIEAVNIFSNQTIIKFSNQIMSTPMPLFSFYDPFERKPESMHGTLIPGIFMNFVPNKGKLKTKSFGSFHEVRKVKDIVEINLNLAYNNKIYKIRNGE